MGVMSLAELKEKAAALPVVEQAELSAYLAERLRQDDPTYRKELARLIDDRNPENWVRWDAVKKDTRDQESTSVTTRPWTSVRRRSMPLW